MPKQALTSIYVLHMYSHISHSLLCEVHASSTRFILKTIPQEAGEMAQGLRALTAFREDPGPVLGDLTPVSPMHIKYN